jgi:PAS domain S-box-containing protein
MSATVSSASFGGESPIPVVIADTPLQEVIAQLHQADASVAHVVRDGRVVGQFSQRDLLRLIATETYRADEAIAQVMTPVQTDTITWDSRQTWSDRVFEAGPLGIALADLHSGQFLRVNPTFCQITGYTEAELLEKTFFDITHPEDLADERLSIGQNIQRISSQEIDAVNYEKRYIRKDGTTIWCSLTASLVCDECGNPLYAIGMIADISDRKHYEQELQRRETQWQLFVEHSPAAIAMFDREMRYVAVSDRWLTDYGLVGQNLIGRSHYEVFPEIPDRWKAIHQHCLTGDVAACEEDPFLRLGGQLDWVRWEVRPWHEPSGEVGGLIMFTEVITDRKQAEDALRQSEATNQALLNAIPDLMIRMTADGTYLNFIPAKGFKTFGMNHQRIGRSMFEVVPREFAEQRLHYIHLALETQTLQIYEYQLEIQGELRYEEARIAPINDREVLVIVRDIGDLKRYETQLQHLNEALEERIQERTEELAEAYRQLTFHIENAPLGFIEWDENFCVKAWSQQSETLFGYSAREVLGKQMTDLNIVYPDDWDLVNEKARNLINRSEPRQFCLNRNLTKDRRVIHCEWYNSSLFAPDGRLISIFSLVQDVTARIEAEAALRERIRSQQLISDISSHFIYLDSTALDNAIHQGLATIGEFTGFERSYLILLEAGGTVGRLAFQWHDHGVPPIPPQWHRIPADPFGWWMAQLHANQVISVPTLEALPPDAINERYALTSAGTRSLLAIPLLYGNQLMGYIGLSAVREEKTWPEETVTLLRLVGEIFVNAIQRQRIEQALRDSEQKLRLAMDSADMGVWEMDLRTRTAIWSEQVERLFGMPPGSFSGNFEVVNEAICPEDRPIHDAAIAATLEQGQDFNPEFRIVRPDGEIRWLASWGDVIRDDQGTPQRMIGVVGDITHRKLAEEILRQSRDDLERRVWDRTRELEALTDQLKQSNQELEQFAYVASHDLQEPLRAVTSYTQLLERKLADCLDDRSRKYMHYIVDGATRMQQLIQDLLAYSRAGRYELRVEPTDCNTVLEQVLRNLEVAIAESGAIITHDLLPILGVDAGQLTQLLQNLVGNGIKYRSEAIPRIHITAIEQEKNWQFSVQDNGIGIDPKYAERIFVIFQRLHTRREYSGTGIGLALCKKIVERHGGRIWVESTPGTGSTFYFTLSKGGNMPMSI